MATVPTSRKKCALSFDLLFFSTIGALSTIGNETTGSAFASKMDRPKKHKRLITNDTGSMLY
jgi:hypothetical protein